MRSTGRPHDAAPSSQPVAKSSTPAGLPSRKRHAHHLVAGGHGAVPRAAIGHEEAAAILRRELGARVEGEPDGRRVRLDLHGGRRHAGRSAAPFSKRSSGIALPPTIRQSGQPWKAPSRTSVIIVGRHVVAAPVALVHGGPERAGARLEGQAHRVAQPGGEDALARAVGVVAQHRRAALVALAAHVAGGAHRDVHAPRRARRPRCASSARRPRAGSARPRWAAWPSAWPGRSGSAARGRSPRRRARRPGRPGRAAGRARPPPSGSPSALPSPFRSGRASTRPRDGSETSKRARRVQRHEAQAAHLGREHLDGEARGDFQRRLVLRAGGGRPREQRQQQGEGRVLTCAPAGTTRRSPRRW